MGKKYVRVKTLGYLNHRIDVKDSWWKPWRAVEFVAWWADVPDRMNFHLNENKK